MALCVRNTARHSTTFDLDNTWVMSCFRVYYIHRNVYVKKEPKKSRSRKDLELELISTTSKQCEKRLKFMTHPL